MILNTLVYERKCSRSVMSNSLQPMDCSHQVPLSIQFSRQEYSGWWAGGRGGFHILLQGIFPTQSLLQRQAASLPLEPPNIQSMEFCRPEYWSGVDFPFSRGSSQPRDQTQVSHIAGGFFTR